MVLNYEILAVQSYVLQPQTLETIERLSAEPIQEKQGLRENHSTSARVKDEVP